MKKAIEKLQAAPGFYIVIPFVEEESTSQVLIKSDREDTYRKGVIVSAGGIQYDKNGVAIKPFFKIGDRVRFYIGGQEEIHEEGETAYIIDFKQVGARYES